MARVVRRPLPEADEGHPHVERGLVQLVDYVVYVSHRDQVLVVLWLFDGRAE